MARPRRASASPARFRSATLACSEVRMTTARPARSASQRDRRESPGPDRSSESASSPLACRSTASTGNRVVAVVGGARATLFRPQARGLRRRLVLDHDSSGRHALGAGVKVRAVMSRPSGVNPTDEGADRTRRKERRPAPARSARREWRERRGGRARLRKLDDGKSAHALGPTVCGFGRAHSILSRARTKTTSVALSPCAGPRGGITACVWILGSRRVS